MHKRQLNNSMLSRLITCALLVAITTIKACPQSVGVSTNLLYDAALVPNLGAEIFINKKYSIKGNYMWAWWSKNSSHRYWRNEGGELEARLWLSNLSEKTHKNEGEGFHAGVYGGMITYDLEFGGKGWQAPRWSWHTGVSGGYAMPLNEHLKLDFNIGIGYLWGKYYEYEPHSDGHYWWTSTKQRKWIGPTKAEVTLVWHFGKGGKNE